MCGISGIYNFDGLSEKNILDCQAAIKSLNHRGPDYQTATRFKNICLGHSRLSIIDTSEDANQPFQDESKRYVLIYNGEIYNYRKLRQELRNEYNVQFQTDSDTEVLLYWLIKKGSSGINHLNGFFAFALLDREKENLLIARDRYGIKPLLYFSNANEFIFASEMRAIQKFDFEKKLDFTSLYTYMQLSYIPSPYCIYQGVKKLEPGYFMQVSPKGKVDKKQYYQLRYTVSPKKYSKLDYGSAKNKIVELLSSSVEKRLVADVPLGTFLSGGVDSSIITALAAQHKKNLNTFSIGYKDEPYFDETDYALSVAKKYHTDHYVFQLGNEEIKNSIYAILEDVDEPFADSSAIAMNILTKKTKEHVTVALSGDGADELFSGYNKHMAEYIIRKNDQLASSLNFAKYLLPLFPQSRNSRLGNLGRKAKKFIESSQLSAKDRYWHMASLMNESSASRILLIGMPVLNYIERKTELLNHLENNDFNDVLYTDFKMVLQSDMLYKVDHMSMKNSLEVRVPFLDHELVDFVFQLPAEFKIKGRIKKRILQDTFQDILPEEIYHRPKKGFEAPLLKLFRGDLRHLIDEKLLSNEFLIEQNIFDPEEVNNLKKQLNSNQPSNSQQIIWSLLLFNTWWIKNF